MALISNRPWLLIHSFEMPKNQKRGMNPKSKTKKKQRARSENPTTEKREMK